MKKLNAEDVAKAQLELTRDMFIVNLALAGISQLKIAKIVQVDVHRVNNIGKLLKGKRDEKNGA